MNFLFMAILIAVFSDAFDDGRCLMPSSQIANISTITGWIADIQPASILDVGVGFGKYGVLAREYTDVRAGRYRRSEWKVTIDGIEIYSPYYNPIWQIYDRIYCEDVVAFLPHLRNYELILLCDVIEHFEKPVGESILRECMKIATHAVIVSTPSGPYPQGPMHGNEHERHKSEWKIEDFRGWMLRFEGYCLSALYRKNRT
ncbi:MAG TPA: hypothetical protein PLA77_11700 [Bacteroidales bacterium]|nr:hypothetical protein [Bacteroidales bacterium]